MTTAPAGPAAWRPPPESHMAMQGEVVGGMGMAKGEKQLPVRNSVAQIAGDVHHFSRRSRYVHGDNVTVAFWSVAEGAAMPEHARVHEQVSMVTSGRASRHR